MEKIGFNLLMMEVGLILSTVIALFTPINIKIDPEYINGILTVSGILFVFWIYLLEKPREKHWEKWKLKHIISYIVFLLFSFLIFSVILRFASAIDFRYSLYALIFVSFSFFINAGFLSIALYFHFKRITKDCSFSEDKKENS